MSTIQLLLHKKYILNLQETKYVVYLSLKSWSSTNLHAYTSMYLPPAAGIERKKIIEIRVGR